MKKSISLSLFLMVFLQGIAQSNSSTAESDSLFKVFLMKTRGIKFDERKDSVAIVPMPSKQSTGTDNKSAGSAPKDKKKESSPDKDSSNIPSKTQSTTSKGTTTKPVVSAKNSNTKSDSIITQNIHGQKHILDTVSLKPKIETNTVSSEKKTGLRVFKDKNSSYALEAERKGALVKLYLKMEDIEQYSEVILVRSPAELGNFTDVRHIPIIKGANKFEYVETEDRYPLPSKVAAAYKVRAVTKDGAIRMFPAIVLEPGFK